MPVADELDGREHNSDSTQSRAVLVGSRMILGRYHVVNGDAY